MGWTKPNQSYTYTVNTVYFSRRSAILIITSGVNTVLTNFKNTAIPFRGDSTRFSVPALPLSSAEANRLGQQSSKAVPCVQAESERPLRHASVVLTAHAATTHNV
jgi:hypothetical protein